MTNNALAVLDNSEKALIIFDENKIDLIKRTVAKGATDDELALFLHQSQRMGLDPLARQIHFQKYNTKNGPQIAIITGIDGYRLIADRTGCYAGSDEPEFEGRINYAGKEAPAKATVRVWKIVQGKRVPFAASVYWSEYVPDKGRDFQWIKMPHVMLAKCAEAAALRKAFPADLSGAYIHEEMQQAEWFDLKGGDVVEGEVIQEPKTLAASVVTDGKGNSEHNDVDYTEAKEEAAADRQPAKPVTTKKQTAPPNGKGDSNPLMIRFHELGNKLWADKWDEKRAIMVADLTDGKSESSKDLSQEQLQQAISEMAQMLNERLAK